MADLDILKPKDEKPKPTPFQILGIKDQAAEEKAAREAKAKKDRQVEQQKRVQAAKEAAKKDPRLRKRIS